MLSTPTMIKIIGMAVVITSYFLCKYVGETLTGRIGRRRFIVRQFVIILFSVLLGVIGAVFKKSIVNTAMIRLEDYIIIYFMLCALIFSWWFIITTDVKRLHDMNVHGIWLVIFYGTLVACAVFLPQAPLIGAAIYFIPRLLLCVIPGSKDVNKYGYNHDKNYIL